MIIKTFKRFYDWICKEIKEVSNKLKEDNSHFISNLSIYEQLKIKANKLLSTELDLNKDPKGLGSILSYSENVIEFRKSMLQLNKLIEENRHIRKNQLYLNELKSIDLDSFIFIHDGYYINNPYEELMNLANQIFIYADLMNGSEKEIHGVREHNHRQLYSLTVNTTEMLEILFNHFAK